MITGTLTAAQRAEQGRPEGLGPAGTTSERLRSGA
jgi:hypothetical protein